MAIFYSKKVLKHFTEPRYYGKMKNPDGRGKVGNPVCGDVLEIYLKIGKKPKKQGDYIKDISFQTLGCCAAIAVSDALCDLAKGKAIENALKIKNNEIVNSLGGLPAIKYHCSLLGVDALWEAIYDYLNKNKKPIPENLKLRHRQLKKENHRNH